jgi:hypothetical protein
VRDSTSVQLVVAASQTITHDDYRATAGGNFSAVGEAPAVTYVGQPVIKYYYFVQRSRLSIMPIRCTIRPDTSSAFAVETLRRGISTSDKVHPPCPH